MDPGRAAVLSDFVLDASATMVLVMDDEPEEPVIPIVSALRDGDAVVPGLWRFEVANALDTSRRRGRIDDAGFAYILGLVESIRVAQDADPPSIGSVLGLSREHGVTAYDAAYLSLALRRALPLATTDRRLRAVAEKCGVPLVC